MPVANKEAGGNLWEKTWTVDEMNQSADNWSLAADAGLLNYLKEFATRLTSKAHESSQAINSLVHNTQLTNSRVKIVTNQFLTLSNSQFIENRVYDEDVSNDKTENSKEEIEVPKTREEREQEIIPRIKEAVELGIKVLDDAYEVLDVGAVHSDFDSEDSDAGEENGGQTQGIYEPKDPYIHRPLPHLIGSRGFHETDNLGIGDFESEDETVNQTDDISSSDSSDESDVEVTKRKESYSDSMSSDYSSEISMSDDEVDHHRDKEKKTTIAKDMFDSSSSGDGIFDEEKPKVPNDDDDSFSEEEVVEVKPKAKVEKHKKKHKQQADSAELFGNSDDEGDLFNESGLFGTGSNLFSEPKKKKQLSNLFDDGVQFSDDENSEIGSTEHETSDEEQPDKQSLKKESRASSFVSLSNKPKANPAAKNSPFGGVSLFGGAITKNFFNKDADDSKSSDKEDSEEDKQLRPKNPPKQTSSLFDSESEDDLFSNVSKTPRAKESVKPQPKKVVEPKKATTQPPQKTTKGLFDSGSESDEDLFSAIPKKPNSHSVVSSSSATKSVTSTKSKGGLFLEESDNNEEVKPKSPQAQKKDVFGGGKSTLFNDDESESDDMFGAPPIKSESKRDGGKTKLVMFDSSDSDENDLFSTTSKKTIDRSSSSQHKSTANESIETQENLSSSEEEIPPKPTEKKKLPMAGAVPMFMGSLKGSELANAINKRRSDKTFDSENRVESEPLAVEEVDHTKKAAGDVCKEESTSNDLKKKDIKVEETRKSSFLANTTARPFSLKPESSVETVKPVSIPNIKSEQNKNPIFAKMSGKINIDPTHLLPGAAPKPKVIEKVEVSFDKPPKFKTLENVTKTRSKGQANRRPPSKGKKSQTVSKSSPKREIEDSPSTTQQPKVASSNEKKTIEENIEKKKPISNDKVKPTKIKNLSEDEEEDFFSKPVEKKKAVKMFDDDLFNDDDDLFAIPETIPPKKTYSTIPIQDDDIFADDDALFGDLDLGLKTKKIESKDTKREDSAKKGSVDIFGDDDSDIFGDSEAKQSPKPDDVSSNKPKSKDIFDDDIFGDDDDDLFAAPASKPEPKAEKTKQTKKAADDIFDDSGDDDLFQSTKSKDTTKNTVVANSKSKKHVASIFDDDIDDDLFASSTKSKTKTQKPKSKTKDKFDNDNIFDDPLSALQ